MEKEGMNAWEHETISKSYWNGRLPKWNLWNVPLEMLAFTFRQSEIPSKLYQKNPYPPILLNTSRLDQEPTWRKRKS